MKVLDWLQVNIVYSIVFTDGMMWAAISFNLFL